MATVFEFTSRKVEGGVLSFSYVTHFEGGEKLEFTERITLADPNWQEKLPAEFVQNILEDLHLVLGTSYYKLFCPRSMKTGIALSQAQADFWNTLYRKGLGEFLYRNNLPFSTIAQFTASTGATRVRSTISTDVYKVLIGIGGGKDSIVALELLKDYDRTGFIKETGRPNTIGRAVAQRAGVPLVTVSRELDSQLLAGVPGSYRGHVPVSAMYAFFGVLTAALGSQASVVVANEYSGNFGNVVHDGQEVNHKWSGSGEFEALFQQYVHEQLTPSIRYFSLTRPFYEMRVMKLFTELGKNYFDVFSSCNRNFTHEDTMRGTRWCGRCPKCAFTFLLLCAFLPKEEVIKMYGKDLLEDESLLPLYRDLLGQGELKPFDCVGTFDEAKVALWRVAERQGGAKVVRELLPQLTSEERAPLEARVFAAQKVSTVPSRFRMLGMESALILGYGREGKASEQYLAQRYPSLTLGIADAQDGADYLAKQGECDIVIKTPVIPAREVTRSYTTATNFFLADVPRERIIGITGSKGKSTTATLIHSLLEAGGMRARLLGNIGIPALGSIMEKPLGDDEWVVMELSSYQLEDSDTSPHIAVVTSLFPDHLDYHGGKEAYFEAKHSITKFQDSQDHFWYQKGFARLEEWGDATLARARTPEDLPFTFDNPHLLGSHNRGNVALARMVARQLGVDDSIIERVVKGYEGLPHRLQLVGTFKGITFYDDSISVAPDSTLAALEAIPNTHTLILGGSDRGLDFSMLEPALRKSGVKTLILFPETGARMLSSEEGFTVLHTSDMEEGVAFAYEHTPEGSACVLSPASPSYLQFKNFEERGDTFADAVRAYSEK